jgi:hypothetical protein
MLSRHERPLRRSSLTAGLAAIAVGAAFLSAPGTANAAPAGPAAIGHLSSGQASALAKGSRSGVIVLLKNQHGDAPANRSALATRSKLVKADQSPFLSELKQVKASAVHSYTLLNGFAAQVTQAEAQRLAADPSVARVVPDVTLHLASSREPAVSTRTQGKAGSQSKPTIGHGVCPADPGKPLLEPEALQLSHTAYNDSSTPQASKYATGKGVKVGIIANDIDVNNPEFIRANGDHVIFDKQNFTGRGWGGAAQEAFGDASSIAAQGSQVYDLSQIANPNAPLPKNCNVRVRGMAPDASLALMNVFADGNALNSTLLQGIDYAVTQDNVNVLNESFGFDPMPETARDTVVAANDAATAAGVTVVASSGDQGPEGTVGSPADDPHVIDAAGSTAFRVLQQLGWDGATLDNGRWYSNQISTFSSGGVTPTGRTPDVVATAERGWIACSKDLTTYPDCVMRDGGKTNVFPFGGTSESAPLVSGEAALVVQAYKDTHHGKAPTPALVKQLITSTASDLGDPADEQGAGQFNALAAVQAARSYHDRDGSPKTEGSALVLGRTQLSDQVLAGKTAKDTLPVTNTSGSTQTVYAHGRTLGGARTIARGTVALDTTKGNLPTFFDQHYNSFRGYVKTTIKVPSGVDYLALSAAYPAAGARVTEPQMALFDPSGALAAEAYHGAGSGFAKVDLHNPVPGTYTVVFSSINDASKGFKGSINFQATVQNFRSYGSVSPSKLVLKPGRTGAFHVSVKAGSVGGDTSAQVVLTTRSHLHVAAPWTVRTVVAAKAGGSFSGTLSGANASGQIQGFYLQVPKGKRDLSVGITFGNSDQTVVATLVAPNGQPLSFGSNVVANKTTSTLQLFRQNPQPGRWFLGVEMANPTAGSHVTTPYRGRVAFNTVSASAKGLPSSAGTKLSAGTPVTVQVKVRNTGNSTALFFTDGRLKGGQATYPIISPTATTGLPLNNGAAAGAADQGGGQALWPVPTETTGLTFVAESTTQIGEDVQFGSPDWAVGGGNPDYYGTSGTNSATVKVGQHGDELAPGPWNSDATAYGLTAGSVLTDTVNLTATARTAAFDPALAGATGDVWLNAVSKSAPAFAPVSLAPGQTGTLTVTITPSAAKGSVVKGTLYVDTYNTYAGTGDELVGIPYTYTVG